MIVLDSSALVAIFENEPDAGRFAAAMAGASQLLISAVNLHETGVVLRARRGPEALARLWRFLLVENDVQVIPFDAEQARLAISAFEQFGKGMGHKAQLNLTDCAAYALAKSLGVPLLFKGDDFAATDIGACP